jgi:hypothetical protein
MSGVYIATQGVFNKADVNFRSAILKGKPFKRFVSVILNTGSAVFNSLIYLYAVLVLDGFSGFTEFMGAILLGL